MDITTTPAEMNDLTMSEKSRPLLEAVKQHIRDNVDPILEDFERLGQGRADRFSYAPGQLELLEGAKQKAKEAGLWNFFLPNAETGEGLSNLDYAYLAVELGKNPWPRRPSTAPRRTPATWKYWNGLVPPSRKSSGLSHCWKARSAPASV